MHAIRTSRDLATRFRLTKSTKRPRSTLAIARQIPDSFTNALSHHASASTDDAVSLSKSRCQHEIYLQALRHHVPTICLPPLEANPDCAFVEDTVVAIGNVAVICRLGHVSRQGESDSIKDVLVQLGVEVIDMRDYKYSDGNADELACCDGGDVLYTGRHLFVGLSERTNVKGFELLQCVFGDKVEVVLVPPVIQGKDVLHLKSAVTHLDENTLLAPTGSLGDNLLDTMRTKQRGYADVRVDDMLSTNAVVVNGHVLAQGASSRVTKDMIEIACSERGLELTFVDTSELAKKDAALTCCSVLLSL